MAKRVICIFGVLVITAAFGIKSASGGGLPNALLVKGKFTGAVVKGIVLNGDGPHAPEASDRNIELSPFATCLGACLSEGERSDCQAAVCIDGCLGDQTVDSEMANGHRLRMDMIDKFCADF